MIDPELKSYLDGMEARLEERLTLIIRDLLVPIVALIESHGRELQEIREILERAEARFDAMQARFDLHGGKLRSGAEWTVRMDRWSEKAGELLIQRDKDSATQGRRILALEERTAKIERLIRKET